MEEYIKNFLKKLNKEMNEVSWQEIAKAMNVSPKRVRKIREVISLGQPASLDKPFEWGDGKSEHLSLLDILPDISLQTGSSTEEAADKHFLEIAIRKSLESLARSGIFNKIVRGVEAMRFRFGLDDGTSHTLEETGERFGVTREAIRQGEKKILDLLKENPLLRSYYDQL